MQLVDNKMHWQFGGNFEPVKIVCELDWKECPAALANYIWTEIVTDVIECFNNEGLIWRILAMLVVCILLLHILYSKTRWRNADAVNRKSLNKVGYKVQDLELKVNILTYKMQYGTWPLPHQLRQSAFRKELRNLRLTLSSSNHRNAWIKQLLLSPLQNNSCISYPKFDPRSTKNFTDFINMETGRTSSDTQHGISAIDCSASKSSKTSIDNNSVAQPATKRSEISSRSSEKVDFKVHGASTSENSVLGRRTKKYRQENEELPVRPQSQRRSRRQNRFSRTIDECKKYLRELRNSNRNLGLASSASELSDASSVRTERNNAQTILRSSREITDMLNEAEKRREKKPIKSAKNSKRQQEKFLEEEEEEVKESLENDLNASNCISSMKKVVSKKIHPPTLNITFHAKMFPRDPSIEELASILASNSPKREEKSSTTSRETLHQVKTRLESLQNVLKSYEAKDSREKALKRSNRNEEKVKNICRSVAATLKSIREEIDHMYESRSSAVTFEVDADEAEESGENFRNGKRTRTICFDVEGRSKAIDYPLQDRSKAVDYRDTRRCRKNKADYRSDAIHFDLEKQVDKGIDNTSVSPTSLRSSDILRLCQQTFAMNFQTENSETADFFLEDLPSRSSRCYETNTKYLQTCFDTDLDKIEEDSRSPTSFKGFVNYSDGESQSFDISEKAKEKTKEIISEENASDFCRDEESEGKLEERAQYAFSTDSYESGIYRSIPVLEELQEERHIGSSKNTGRSKFSENGGKSDRFSDELSKYPVPMETDEDVISFSHASSRSDASGHGQPLKKTTGILLGHDRTGKQGILTRLDIQKIKEVKENRQGKTSSDAEDERNRLLDEEGEDSPRTKFLEIINEENNAMERFSNDKTLSKHENDNTTDSLQCDKFEEQYKSDKNTKIRLDNEMFCLSDFATMKQNIDEETNADPKTKSQLSKDAEKNNNESSSAIDKAYSSNRCSSSSSSDNVNNLKEELLNCKHELESIPSEYFSLSNLALRENFPRVGNINELVLRSAKSIKNYTDIFSFDQNQAIHETRKAIQHQNETKDEASGYPESERTEVGNCTKYSAGNEEFKTAKIDKVDTMNLKHASLGKFETSVKGCRGSVEGSEVDPNLTLKRHRGMFSIAEKILPKMNKEDNLKVFEKFEAWDYEQKGVKRKRIEFDDIDVIHRSLKINESNQDLSSWNFRPIQNNLPVNVEKTKFHEAKEHNSFDSSWKNILCTGVSDSSITDNKKIMGEYNEPEENFISKSTKEDDKKDKLIQSEMSVEKNEGQLEMNNEKVFTNYRSVFASHCSNSCFIEETSNFKNNNSANTDDCKTQVCRIILEGKEGEPLGHVKENANTRILSNEDQIYKNNLCDSEATQNASIYHKDKENDFDLRNDNDIKNIHVENNVTPRGKIQNSDPTNNPSIVNDIQLPIKCITEVVDASSRKETEHVERKERTDCQSKVKIESESFSSNINADSTTSGSYIDASSHDLIAPNKIDFEKFLANKTDKFVTNNPQCPSVSSIPRKNNFTWVSKTNPPLAPLKRQESGNCRLKTRSNSNLSSATNPTNRKRDSSEESNNRPSRSNINVACQKRSRSYVTPRKSESSPRYSNTVQKMESKTILKCDSSSQERKTANEKVVSGTKKIESSQQTINGLTNDDKMCKNGSSGQNASSVRGKEEKSIYGKKSEPSPRKTFEGEEKGDDKVCVNLGRSESSPRQVSSTNETTNESIRLALSKSESSSEQTCSRKSMFSSRQGNGCQTQSRTRSKENGNLCLDGKSKSKTPSKSHIPVLKVTSKSSIPILKGRLDSARKNERDVRPRSPARGPLTMTMMWNENERIVSENQKETAVCAEGTQINKLDDEIGKDFTAKETQVIKDCTADEIKVNAMQINKSYAQVKENYGTDETGLRNSSVKSTQINRNVVIETVQISKECSTESTQVNKSPFVGTADIEKDHSTESTQTNKIDIRNESHINDQHFTKDVQTNFTPGEEVISKEKSANEHPEKFERNEKSEHVATQLPKSSGKLFEQSSASTTKEKMVIYVNILTKHDSNVTRIVDPRKFMEYVKSRETKVEKPLEEDSRKRKVNDSIPEIHRIISNENEATSTGFTEQFLRTDTLSKAVVKSSWPVKEQKETDVTAKPSVTETSTSISDLRATSDILKTADRFQVFGVPKELTNEEYVVLLDALNQESNVLHLQEIRNLCNRLETNARHSE